MTEPVERSKERCLQPLRVDENGRLSDACILRGFLDNQDGAVTIKDRELRYVIVNRAACELHGIPENAMIGKTAREVFDDDKALAQETLDRQVFSGKHSEDHEEVRVRDDGVVDYYSVNRTLIRGCHGAEYLVQTNRNISEQRRVAERLTNLYSIINLGPVIAFRVKVDRGLAVEFMSENIRQLGYRLLDFYRGHMRLDEIVYPEDKDRIQTEVAQAASSARDQFTLEFRVITVKGRVLWYAGRVSAIRNELGHVTHYQGVAFDISERRAMEADLKKRQQQLIQADKMVSIGTLVSGVAHEINNPAGFIMLNAPMLEEMWQPVLDSLVEYADERRVDQIGKFKMALLKRSIPQMLHGITEGAERIKSIVKSLKDFSRQSSGDMDEKVDMNEVAAASVGLVSNSMNEDSKKFTVEYADRSLYVRGNFQRLQQVVVNLLVNACEALLNEEQSVCVVTGFNSRQKSVLVSVIDEGVGISKENIPKVVDPFFTTKRDSGGTGLGLSISSSIVTDHGGRLVFESEEGRGTVATVWVPVYGDE